MIIKALSIPTGVLHSFDHKPGSSKFYIALKSSSFSFISFLLFAALKSGVTITSQDHIYFSQPGSFGSLRILIPMALLDSQKFPPTPTMNLRVDYPLFIVGFIFSRVREIRVCIACWKPTDHSDNLQYP